MATRARQLAGRTLAVLGIVAVLTPALAAWEPDLAGWTHSHGHVYEDGVPASHAHPWDRIPLDGAATPLDDHAHTTDEQATGVTFTWDTNSTVVAMLLPAALVVVLAAAAIEVARRRPALAPASLVPAVPTPPPR